MLVRSRRSSGPRAHDLVRRHASGGRRTMKRPGKPSRKHTPSRAQRAVSGLSARALSTPEPFVRLFARRVQQEGALDLTQGDYKNADFAPHPEVVRAAQRITRNTVHSYGPAVGRMDVRSEVADFFNRDGLLDYPDSEVRFLPDEVLFTPGTRAGLAIVLEVLGADGSGVVVPRPSWEYDWFIERAGKKVVELPTAAPEFLPDPKDLDRLLAKGGISSVILNNPHNPTGRVYPRSLVEEIVRVAVRHRCYVLYDSVYQRLDYVGWFVNPAFASPEWRDWVVSLSGLSKMDMFGASTGARACWLIISDQVRSNGVRAREILANLSAWLVATPSTLAQDWALAALQSPLAALRRPSPYMRERRDFMLRAADELAHLGIERTDFGGTFYAPLAFPGLVGEPFDRLRNGVHEKAIVRNSVDAFEFLLSGGVGGIPFAAFAGGPDSTDRYGTWQRLSYGSKDVKELAVFMDRVQARIEQQGRLGAGAVAPPKRRAGEDETWEGTCTARGYGALDGLDRKAFAAARRRFLADPRRETLRLTGTKHPDSTAHRAEQLERALKSVPRKATDPAHLALKHLEWNPLMEARLEYEESIADLLGPCSEVLLDMEGRQISPDWLDVPEKVALALLRRGIVPGEDRHLLLRVPNPFLEQDEEKVSKILASVARTNVLFHLACEHLGIEPKQNAIHEITIPQVNSSAEIGAVIKIGTLYLQAVAGLFEGTPDRVDAFLSSRVPRTKRAAMIARVSRVRLVPLCENVGALAHLPDLLEKLYVALERGIGVEDLPTPGTFRTSFDQAEAEVRVFVAMSDTALQSGKIATDAACTLAVAGREEAERRLAVHARRIGEPAPRVTYLIGAGRAGFRGGFDPAHPGVITQFAQADGVTMQGIRADAPQEASRLAEAFRARVAARSKRRDRVHALSGADAESMARVLEAGVKAHTETLLRIAPLLAPIGSLVPQPRVRNRATGAANYGRSIPTYPPEWGGGQALPDDRDLRDAWPEGVTLPRAIVYNLACTTLGLPAVTSDLSVLDRRTAVLLERHVPGYREIIASELPSFVKDAAALVFGRKLAETTARRCLRAAAALWVDARARDDLVAPTCLFAMQYLRYMAEDSESWDETKEHESQTTREEELIRETSSVAFAALCAERPGDRWPVLQAMVDAEDAPRLLLARELTIEEKREFVDLRIEGWLRGLPESLSQELRREWSQLRELAKDEFELDAIRRLIALEKLRGSRGA
ncbi:MAG: aminotransferase class I/II-fold pyridoxal phosphate-dependent enzyme [Gammaproteobacteria bacterium]|nr:aminotransferase class I/II-fold pyridoxal phosphate-dependent enzyme [Gammaproteobacteria bacterium]